MGKYIFEAPIRQLLDSIKTCLENKYITPSLILIYSGIDILSWLGNENGDVKKADFISWSNEYLINESKLICSGEDLYAARCGIVHSMSPESNLSRKGEANRIFYAWGNRDTLDLKEKIDEMQKDDIIVIHVNDLFEALINGFDKFLEYVDSNSNKIELIEAKAKKLLVNSSSLN